MNYWELKDRVKKIVPRKSILDKLEKEKSIIKEKGRKKNYYQYDLEKRKMITNPKLLNTEQINSFLEVSLRAAHCPMPLNADVYDSIECPGRCRYCFATSFKASLYTSFFDNSDQMGIRFCDPSYFKKELDRLMGYVGKKTAVESDVVNALRMRIPIRLGIRYDDFHPGESRQRISQQFLEHLSKLKYPVMINTKYDLVGKDPYVRILADNPAGSAVHITAISSDPVVNKKLEPGAPSFERRVWAMKQLTDAGIRVVARIEPFMTFINDDRDRVMEWVEAVKNAGVRHVTLDTYSYSAAAPGIRRQIEREGYDFDRMFDVMSDSQWLGSLMLSKFIEFLASQGLLCSTFDFGCVPKNHQDVCCEVGDWFTGQGGGFSRGNTLFAIRYIQKAKSKGKQVPISWNGFDTFVQGTQGWLSKKIQQEVFEIWNGRGNQAFGLDWANGIEPHGVDREGNLKWIYNPGEDFREKLLEAIW